MKIADLRTEYMRETLDESSVDSDPFRQFERWFAEAVKADEAVANAMTLATVGADGEPSARIVLLKESDERGFVFFGNYESRKGRAMAVHDVAALLFFWPGLERQVRIEGTVTRIDPEESTIYFHQRPRPAQLGAWASPQSAVIADRAALEARYAAVAAQYGADEGTVPRPPHWGGYRLAPTMIEFWQGRVSRLHDRIRFRRAQEDRGAWIVDRLAP